MNPLEWALLSRTARAILRIFNGFKSRGQAIFCRQSWLASEIRKTEGHCTREQVNRCISKLALLGFISKLERHSRFWTYRLEKCHVTPERTPHVTSHGRSSFINSVVQRKAPSKAKAPRTNWHEFERLWRSGVSEDEAMRRATA